VDSTQDPTRQRFDGLPRPALSDNRAIRACEPATNEKFDAEFNALIEDKRPRRARAKAEAPEV
jgi:hypothetical protein